MSADVEEEYARLLRKFEDADFTQAERSAIAERLDADIGLSAMAARLWMLLPVDLAFSAQPAMFMARPPGENISGKTREHIQWTWRDHHFMLFAAPLAEPSQSMLGLLVADADPVLEVHVEHQPDDRTIIRNHRLHAMRPGVWVDDFMSYCGAFFRMRAASEATREKFRVEMEGFWRRTGV